MGEAEGELQRVFQSARRGAPSLVLFEDLDLICPHRGDGKAGSGPPASESQKRLVSCLLSLVDGVDHNQGVFIIGMYVLQVSLFMCMSAKLFLCMFSLCLESSDCVV